MNRKPRQARQRKPGASTSNNAPSYNVQKDFHGVPGLIYIEDFLSVEEHDKIMSILYNEQNEWWVYEEVPSGETMKRRNQQSGWKYSYATQDIAKAEHENPDWAIPFGERLKSLGVIEDLPEQMIVNEYLPGQGITPHTDKVHCFGKYIAAITLGSGIIMNFSPRSKRDDLVEVYVRPRSVYIMTGPARYDYLHSIQSREMDIVNGRTIRRKKRVSVTLRTVILPDELKQ